VALVNVAIVGAGNIAARYAECVAAEPRLAFAGASDVVPGRAAQLVALHGGSDYESLAAVLADNYVDVVVNLTAPSVHAEVTAACLEAGKHVHTEKPVALDGAEAHRLAALAAASGVRLSCAPSTLLGEAQQTAWKLVREGGIGDVRVVYAEANWGRIESWHPAPETLYESGPAFDVGIYPLTILTGIFGPVRRVVGYATTLEPNRVRKDGVPFTLATPDFYVAALEFDGGVVARLTATFWVGPGKQRGLEFHGSEASLWMPDWAGFNSRLLRTTDGENYEAVPLVRDPYPGTDWARALVDLADAVSEGRPHRMSAEHAAHVVDVLNAVDTSRREGGAAEVHSSFALPAPMEWAL
jgi:predicted dehydrogenase